MWRERRLAVSLELHQPCSFSSFCSSMTAGAEKSLQQATSKAPSMLRMLAELREQSRLSSCVFCFSKLKSVTCVLLLFLPLDDLAPTFACLLSCLCLESARLCLALLSYAFAMSASTNNALLVRVCVSRCSETRHDC